MRVHAKELSVRCIYGVNRLNRAEHLHHQSAVLCFIVFTDSRKKTGASSDSRAGSLLEDLRSTDPLAREIIDRVDRGAYGTRGRRNGGVAGDTGSADETPPTLSASGKSKVKGGSNVGPGTTAGGPPPSVQGRGRMVGLGQEMEMGGLATAQYVMKTPFFGDDWKFLGLTF